MKWNRFMRTELSREPNSEKKLHLKTEENVILTLNLRWKMCKSFTEMNKKSIKNNDENMRTNSVNDHIKHQKEM